MLITRAQVFLNQSFVCPSCLEANTKKSSKAFQELKSIPYNFDTYLDQKKYFDQKNFFIDQFGSLKMYAFSRNIPFVVDILDNNVNFNERKLTSVCYGCKSHFSFNFKATDTEDTVKCIITPFVHFFPNKSVNIIFSCFLSTDSDDVYALPKCIKAMRQAFFHNRTYGITLTCSKKLHSDINNFQSLINKIQSKISKLMPEYRFETASSEKYTLIQLIKFKTDKFDTLKNDFINFANYVANNGMINKDYFEFNDFLSYYDAKPNFRYEVFSPNELISFISHSYYDSCERALRHYSWQLFSGIEFAQFDKLLVQYIINKALEKEHILRAENRTITRTTFKLTMYDRNFESLCDAHLNSLLFTKNSFLRKLIYCFYGSKENRNQLIDEAKQHVEIVNSLLDNRESIWHKLLQFLPTLQI